jgi:molybdate transport system substrate-binding protein
VALACAAVLAGCGDDERLTIFAASSLTDVLPALDGEAEYSFASSGTLATQIREGAPADVMVSADAAPAQELAAEGLLDDPRPLATNTLALLVPEGNPDGIRGLADLRRPGIRFVIADEGVPLGDYTRELLAELGQSDLAERAASYETDAAATVGKVALGEADAAIGYTTDAARARVEALELPADAQPRIVYTIAVVAGTDLGGPAAAFVDRALGPDGRELLAAGGFGPP